LRFLGLVVNQGSSHTPGDIWQFLYFRGNNDFSDFGKKRLIIFQRTVMNYIKIVLDFFLQTDTGAGIPRIIALVPVHFTKSFTLI